MSANGICTFAGASAPSPPRHVADERRWVVHGMLTSLQAVGRRPATARSRRRVGVFHRNMRFAEASDRFSPRCDGRAAVRAAPRRARDAHFAGPSDLPFRSALLGRDLARGPTVVHGLDAGVRVQERASLDAQAIVSRTIDRPAFVRRRRTILHFVLDTIWVARGSRPSAGLEIAAVRAGIRLVRGERARETSRGDPGGVRLGKGPSGDRKTSW